MPVSAAKRPKPGPGRGDTDCPVCNRFSETASLESCGVVFSLLRAIASGDREWLSVQMRALNAFDAHIAAHVAYLFLYHLSSYVGQHPLDVIDANAELIRESLAEAD